jgi:hypothetical protein
MKYGIYAQPPKHLRDLEPDDEGWKEAWGEEYTESYKLTEVYLEQIECNRESYGGQPIERAHFRPDPRRMVGGGAWIMVTNPPPTNPTPVAFGMYWAVPCKESLNYDGYDKYGRYKVEILMKDPEAEGQFHAVGLFVTEYMVVHEGMFREFMEEGYFDLQQLSLTTEDSMNVELIERGRALVEEERESIWALMLDGLTESKACEEYFLGRHVERDNAQIWYRPIPEFAEYMEDTFGRLIRNQGRGFTEENHQRRAQRRAERA